MSMKLCLYGFLFVLIIVYFAVIYCRINPPDSIAKTGNVVQIAVPMSYEKRVVISDSLIVCYKKDETLTGWVRKDNVRSSALKFTLFLSANALLVKNENAYMELKEISKFLAGGFEYKWESPSNGIVTH